MKKKNLKLILMVLLFGATKYASALDVFTDQTISVSDTYSEHITVYDGATLRIIGCTVSMDPYKEIMVKDGGKLEVINATLTSSSDTWPWRGVKFESQYIYPLPIELNTALEMDNSTIEKAVVGIYCWFVHSMWENENDYVLPRIKVFNSTFVENEQHVFIKGPFGCYKYYIPGEHDAIEFKRNNFFSTTADSDKDDLYLEHVRNVLFTDNICKNENTLDENVFSLKLHQVRDIGIKRNRFYGNHWGGISVVNTENSTDDYPLEDIIIISNKFFKQEGIHADYYHAIRVTCNDTEFMRGSISYNIFDNPDIEPSDIYYGIRVDSEETYSLNVKKNHFEGYHRPISVSGANITATEPSFIKENVIFNSDRAIKCGGHNEYLFVTCNEVTNTEYGLYISEYNNPSTGGGTSGHLRNQDTHWASNVFTNCTYEVHNAYDIPFIYTVPPGTTVTTSGWGPVIINHNTEVENCRDDSGEIDDVADFDPNNQGSALVLKLYPNPVRDWLTIDVSELHTEVTATILDHKGKVWLEEALREESNRIDVSHLEKGSYVVHVQSSTALDIIHLVVE